MENEKSKMEILPANPAIIYPLLPEMTPEEGGQERKRKIYRFL
jgi:hypothetical protein